MEATEPQASPTIPPAPFSGTTSARGSRRLMYGVVAAVLLACFVLFDPVRRPTPGDPTGQWSYYSGLFGVYRYEHRQCGFLGCFGPDIRLFRYKRIPFADPYSFRIVSTGEHSGDIVGVDRWRVYYGEEPVTGGDPATLRAYDGYAADANNIYRDGFIIRSLDRQTFDPFCCGLMRDKSGVYSSFSNPPQRLDLVDGDTVFLPAGPQMDADLNYTIQDKHFRYVFNLGSPRFVITNISNDPTYQDLGCNYLRFQDNIYYAWYAVKDADPATFSVLRSQGNKPDTCVATSYEKDFARDTRGFFFQGKRLAEMGEYGKDRLNVARLLVLPPAEQKSAARRETTYCRLPPEGAGEETVREVADGGPGSTPGLVRVEYYPELGLLDTAVLDSRQVWQQLPEIEDNGLSRCDSINLFSFTELEKKSYLSRRSAAYRTVVFHINGDPVYTILDDAFTVRFAINSRQLIDRLNASSSGGQFQAFVPKESGWRGAEGWRIKDNIFMNAAGDPEVWIPFLFAGKTFQQPWTEGREYVTVGFRMSEGMMACIDEDICSRYGIRP